MTWRNRLMKHAFLSHCTGVLTLLWMIAPAHGAPVKGAIFECSTQAEDYSGQFSLTETGRFYLKAKKGKETFDCDLKLKDYSYNSQAQVANLTLRMSPSSCRGPGGAEYKSRTLVKNMSLVVTRLKTKEQTADVQWITYLQPSDCKINRFETDSLIRGAQRFKEGVLQ